MDFVDWCNHVLDKIVALSVSPEALKYGYLTDSMLGAALFGEEAASNFVGSPLRTRLHTAIDELGRSHLVVKGRLGQMYKLEVTPLGRARSTDIFPLWKEVFAVTLSPDAEQLLHLVNGLSQKIEPDYVWVDDVGGERCPELGGGDTGKRLLAIRELEHHGFVRSFPGLGSEQDLTATYKGLVWETRRAPENAIEPETAHVLFTDIVGYSKLSMDEQTRLRTRLKEVVRATETYRRAHMNQKVISRSTGDGMALVFFGHPAAPVNCAIEVSRALKAYPELKLRMGAHTGPVRRDEDINDQADVAGGGINFAQRVMDAGNARDILLARAVAENLEQMGGWSEYLHDLGEASVKHGARMHVFNLYGGDFGNPVRPKKFSPAPLVAQGEVGRKLEPPAALSIAVLPFANQTGSPSKDFFCDGISEQFILSLSNAKELAVRPRSSSFRFKGTNDDLPEIGKKLNVSWILEGSITLKTEDRLQITVGLINTRDHIVVWSDSYDRESKEVFKVQNEIVLRIVKELKVELGMEERTALLKRYTNDPKVYDCYLNGRFFFNKHEKEGWDKAIEYFYEAISIDPGYAPAYAGLASVLAFTWFYATMPPEEAINKWKEAIERALELGGDMEESHIAAGRFCFLYERNWEEAEREYELAIKINPKNADARHQYGFFPVPFV